MIDWFIDDSIEKDKIFMYDKNSLIRKIYDDCEIIEFNGKPIMKINKPTWQITESSQTN